MGFSTRFALSAVGSGTAQRCARRIRRPSRRVIVRGSKVRDILARSTRRVAAERQPAAPVRWRKTRSLFSGRCQRGVLRQLARLCLMRRSPGRGARLFHPRLLRPELRQARRARGRPRFGGALSRERGASGRNAGGTLEARIEPRARVTVPLGGIDHEDEVSFGLAQRSAFRKTRRGGMTRLGKSMPPEARTRRWTKGLRCRMYK